MSEKLSKLINAIRDITTLILMLFRDDEGNPLKLYSYQVEIVKDIFFKRQQRELCWATTRAGKSLAVAIAIILRALFFPGEKIRIIAPTKDHTRIVMGYVVQHLLDHPYIVDQLAIDYSGMGAERLKRELSKQRITFKNNSEIMILTADIAHEGRALIGHGGTLIIVDEAESIPIEIVRAKIMRMPGDRIDAMVFMISNPTQFGFMYEKKKDKIWKQIKVGWEDCVKAGRLTTEFIEERRKDLSPIEFTIWYEADYPEELEDSLISWKKIEKALALGKLMPEPDKENRWELGVDVASMGADRTVFTTVEVSQKGEHYHRDTQKTSKQSTMNTVGKVIELERQYDYHRIKVDSTGLGTGPVDRLKEQAVGYKVAGINFGAQAARSTRERTFLNLKAEMYWNLRELFESESIYMRHDNKLVDQLSKMRFEITSGGKTKIIDPEGKSPDEADSLALACYNPDTVETIVDSIEF